MKTHAITLLPLAAALLVAGHAAAQEHEHLPAPTEQQDHAQHQAPPPTDHSQHHPQPPPEPEPEPTDESHDHAAHSPQAQEESAPEEVDHSAMGHDHDAMGHAPPTEEQPAPEVDHSAMGHDHGAMQHGAHPAPDQPVTPIPVVTDADRAVAVKPAGGHAMHDNAIQRMVLIDRLEGFDADEGSGVEWEAHAWFGTDLDKLWLRTEGERVAGNTEDADLEVLYGRSFARWWEVVAGIRHHFEPGDSQDMAVIGVMGVAPYKFEVDASLYIGSSGYTGARLEVEYETLLTNRLILQPALEVNFHGKDDPAHGNGSGLGTVEAGLRLRYEFTRHFAPYVGVVHERAYGRTADFRRDEGEDIEDTRFVVGVRLWF